MTNFGSFLSQKFLPNIFRSKLLDPIFSVIVFDIMTTEGQKFRVFAFNLQKNLDFDFFKK